MPPVRKHSDHCPAHLTLCQKHHEYLVLKYCLQLFQLQWWGGAKHAAAAKAAIRHQDTTGRVETQEVAEGLNSNDGTGNGILLRDRLFEKNIQQLPCAAA